VSAKLKMKMKKQRFTNITNDQISKSKQKETHVQYVHKMVFIIGDNVKKIIV